MTPRAVMTLHFKRAVPRHFISRFRIELIWRAHFDGISGRMLYISHRISPRQDLIYEHGP